jgi:SAM-dependent methyltransferase
MRDMARRISNRITSTVRAALPVEAQRWMRARQRQFGIVWPPIGEVQFGDLRRRTPVSRALGFDRGLPIDRYYIQQFLSAHSSDIRGRVLEIGDDFYTQKFGGGRVTRSDVLHVQEGNPKATILADLTRADHVPSDSFDCIIFTQTLQMIYDLRSALRHLYRILRPGGMLLATSHGISKICRRESVDPWGEYWRITTQSARRLFLENFLAKNVEVKAYGNVLAAVAFLHGLAAEELRQEELDFCDPDYEVLVAVAAVKPRT